GKNTRKVELAIREVEPDALASLDVPTMKGGQIVDALFVVNAPGPERPPAGWVIYKPQWSSDDLTAAWDAYQAARVAGDVDGMRAARDQVLELATGVASHRFVGSTSTTSLVKAKHMFLGVQGAHLRVRLIDVLSESSFVLELPK
ncbi:MAG: hypothetical protein AAFY46_15050, partial [Planctomycetota bacterium]